MKKSLACILASLTAQEVFATYGMDIGAPVYEWQCLKNNGIDFAIPRAWHSYGAFDTDSIANVNGAHAAGI
jgi:hypothetical protein